MSDEKSIIKPQKISELNQATSVNSNDLLFLIQNGVNKSVTADLLKNALEEDQNSINNYVSNELDRVHNFLNSKVDSNIKITTLSPLVGGKDLSSDIILSINYATTSQPGITILSDSFTGKSHDNAVTEYALSHGLDNYKYWDISSENVMSPNGDFSISINSNNSYNIENSDVSINSNISCLNNLVINGSLSYSTLPNLTSALQLVNKQYVDNLVPKKGNLKEDNSCVLKISNGESSVFGNGTTIEVQQAGPKTDGYLSAHCYNLFYNKADAFKKGDLIGDEVLNISGGEKSVIGDGVSISIVESSTDKKGVVQLSNSYNGISQDKAVTEKALNDGLTNLSIIFKTTHLDPMTKNLRKKDDNEFESQKIKSTDKISCISLGFETRETKQKKEISKPLFIMNGEYDKDNDSFNIKSDSENAKVTVFSNSTNSNNGLVIYFYTIKSAKDCVVAASEILNEKNIIFSLDKK